MKTSISLFKLSLKCVINATKILNDKLTTVFVKKKKEKRIQVRSP